MEQLCTVLWALLGSLALTVTNIWSWALDNWGKLAAWWAKLPSGAKVLLYAASTAVVGAGFWAAGRYWLQCPGWPSDLDILYMIAWAALSFFTGVFRHEVSKDKQQ